MSDTQVEEGWRRVREASWCYCDESHDLVACPNWKAARAFLEGAVAASTLEALLDDYRARGWYLPAVIRNALAAAQERTKGT